MPIEKSWVCWSKVTKSGKETSRFFVCVGVFLYMYFHCDLSVSQT